jgi:hypothetical protein
MQPVPVQRSRSRSSGGKPCAFCSERTRCVIEAAVSCLAPSISEVSRKRAGNPPWNERARSAPYLQIAKVLGAKYVLQRFPQRSFPYQLV